MFHIKTGPPARQNPSSRVLMPLLTDIPPAPPMELPPPSVPAPESKGSNTDIYIYAAIAAGIVLTLTRKK